MNTVRSKYILFADKHRCFITETKIQIIKTTKLSQIWPKKDISKGTICGIKHPRLHKHMNDHSMSTNLSKLRLQKYIYNTFACNKFKHDIEIE